jgi:hypothetical protein
LFAYKKLYENIIKICISAYKPQIEIGEIQKNHMISGYLSPVSRTQLNDFLICVQYEECLEQKKKGPKGYFNLY